MDLGNIRQEIDSIDNQILDLFLKRMDLCVNVAKYKKENNLPVFQGKREDEILERIGKMAPDNLSDGAKQLFTNIMDISKCLQQQVLTDLAELDFYPQKKGRVTVACPGTAGSNTEQACNKLFSDKDILYFADFADVFDAVVNDRADYGVLPIENSTAGEVSQTYRLLAKYDFYICKSTQINIKHCLAAKKGTKEIKAIYSHEQALAQCSGFVKKSGAAPIPYQNTALAAKMVAENDDFTSAVICSELAASLYGLEILAKDIADNPDNTTRFICISKRAEVSENADIISLSMSLPHTAGSLYRMLTRFSFYGLNLTKIESAPVPENSLDIKTETFDVIFYLDFEGSVRSPEVLRLIQTMKQEMKYFKFLGNYNHID